MTTFTASPSLRALSAYGLCWLSVLSMPALAAGVNSTITTREDTPVPIPLANISNTPCTNIYLSHPGRS